MSRKGRRSRSPSRRGSRVPVRLPARRGTLQKSIGEVWSQIRSAYALQKERPGSSERGPSSERKPAEKPAATTSGEGTPRVGLTARAGEDRQRLRVTRDRHPAVQTSPKGGGWVAGPGLSWPLDPTKSPYRRKASWIIRRCRFHETAYAMVLAIFAPSDPYTKPTGGRTATLQPTRRRGRREGEPQEIATGVPEARSHQRRGKKTPTLVARSRKANGPRGQCCMTIRRSGLRAS
jgi:hypothetical protein